MPPPAATVAVRSHLVASEVRAGRMRWRPNVGTVASVVTLFAIIGLFVVGR
jgi:hypothetical protein